MANFKYSDNQLKSLLDGIFEGEIDANNLPQDLYTAIATYLKKGLYKGFGGDLLDFSGKDLELLTKLRENIYVFSAAKTYQEVMEIKNLLFNEDGERRDVNEFSKLGAAEFDKWNDAWGRTEYNTAVANAQMAVKWEEIEANKDILPTLVFDATGEECPICEQFNGLAAPVDDPVWNWATPTLHFNCMCVLRQEDKGYPLTDKKTYESAIEKKETVSEMFRTNPYKDQEIFPKSHPYFEIPKEDRELAKNNFNLPIPKKD